MVISQVYIYLFCKEIEPSLKQFMPTQQFIIVELAQPQLIEMSFVELASELDP
jgi:hypothetical protein